MKKYLFFIIYSLFIAMPQASHTAGPAPIEPAAPITAEQQECLNERPKCPEAAGPNRACTWAMYRFCEIEVKKPKIPTKGEHAAKKKKSGTKANPDLIKKLEQAYKENPKASHEELIKATMKE
jgi:hypothetical protein